MEPAFVLEIVFSTTTVSVECALFLAVVNANLKVSAFIARRTSPLKMEVVNAHKITFSIAQNASFAN